MRLGHKIVSDGMVLQRGEDFVLTGDGPNGAEVVVSFAGMKKRVRCKENVFSVCFEQLEAGGPYSLDVSCNGGTTTVSDVLVGDVYFMSGQSNMELDINWVYHSFEEEIDTFDSDSIRQFKVPIDYDFNEALTDVAAGSWVKTKGDAKKTFGAIGFFMAKKLYEQNGVPIGLIQTAVPGCPIESFLTKENAEKFRKISLDEICYDKQAMKAKTDRDLTSWQERVSQLLIQDRSMPEQQVKRTVIPLWWENDKEQAGIYTFRRKVNLPKQPEENAILKLGLIIEADYTYVNGKLVGQTEYQYPPRRYVVPKELLHEGENEIVVKVIVTNGVCRFWEKLDYTLQVEETTYDLMGVWEFSKGPFSKYGFFANTFYEYLPYGVYNAMLAPLMDYKVAGLLWYQGESNISHPEGYYKKFKTLVEQFRSQMKNPKFPVYYVQIACYEDPNDKDGIGWAAIRQEQEKAQSIDNAYMVVSGDVGSATDLHPQNKKAIGERIADLVANFPYVR